MSYLKYYRDEEARHPTLHSTGITFEDACEVIERFAKEYGIEIAEVERTSGRNSSHWDGKNIRFNSDRLSWLLVLHEFAHAIVDHEAQRAVAVWRRKQNEFCRRMVTELPQAEGIGSAGPLWRFYDDGGVGAASNAYRRWNRANPCPMRKKGHTVHHAEFVNILARKAVERGWIAALPAERVARDLARTAAERARAAHASDPIVVRSKRIEDRARQVQRLEASIKQAQSREKALRTRLTRAKRSLNALLRHAQPKGTP